MDVFVKYKVGKNSGYAKAYFDGDGFSYLFKKLGRADLENPRHIHRLEILSNDYTIEAATDEELPVCVVGEVRNIANDTNHWDIVKLSHENSLGECAKLSVPFIMASNRENQKQVLCDFVRKLDAGGYPLRVRAYQKNKSYNTSCALLWKEQVNKALEKIDSLDMEEKDRAENFGRFVRYRDHENTGFAEILDESPDSIIVKYLTNEGTKDACKMLLASEEDDYVCIIGKAKTYDKMGSRNCPSVSFSLVENDKELQFCQSIAEGAVLLDNLKRQKEQLSLIRSQMLPHSRQMDMKEMMLLKTEKAIDMAKAYISIVEKEFQEFFENEVDSALNEEEQREI